MNWPLKLRIETADGFHVLSLELARPSFIRSFLVQEINRALREYPEREKLGLIRKTDLLGEQE